MFKNNEERLLKELNALKSEVEFLRRDIEQVSRGLCKEWDDKKKEYERRIIELQAENRLIQEQGRQEHKENVELYYKLEQLEWPWSFPYKNGDVLHEVLVIARDKARAERYFISTKTNNVWAVPEGYIVLAYMELPVKGHLTWKL